jgi:hypothetical protein
MIYTLGTVLAGLAVLLPLLLLGGLLVTIQSAEMLEQTGLDDTLSPISGLGRWVIIAISVALYFTAFLLWSVLTNVFITLPVLRHYFSSLTLAPATAINGMRQRPRDEFAEAEGFADALDVGASL